VQRIPSDLTASDRRVVRRWQLVVVAFYGSLLTLMLVYALVASQDVQVARVSPPIESQKK
jgi:hypothetical protein